MRVLEQLSLIRRELIKTNYPSSIPTTPTPYNGSNGKDDFEVSGYYGKITPYECVMTVEWFTSLPGENLYSQ